MKDTYMDQYGLLNSKKHEIGAENSLLWTLQYILLNQLVGDEDRALELEYDITAAIEYCRISPGLFHQTPVHQDREFRLKDGYMSPDQLISFFIMGFISPDTPDWHKEIWQEIVRQNLFQYNNFLDGKLRLIHPRDWVLYFSLNNPLVGQVLMFVLAIANIVACMSPRPETSGKLLAWTKMVALKDKFWAMKFSWWVCSKLIKKTHGSWSDVFKIYFPELGHPSPLLAQAIYDSEE